MAEPRSEPRIAQPAAAEQHQDDDQNEQEFPNTEMHDGMPLMTEDGACPVGDAGSFFG